MLKAESTIGIILVLIFGMSLGFFTSQTFINNYQKDLTSLQNKYLETLTENLEIKKKFIELKNDK